MKIKKPLPVRKRLFLKLKPDYLSDFVVVVVVLVEVAAVPSAFALQQVFFSPEPEHAFASVFSPEHAFPSCAPLQQDLLSFFFLSSPFLSSPLTVTTVAFVATKVVAEAAPTIPEIGRAHV